MVRFLRKFFHSVFKRFRPPIEDNPPQNARLGVAAARNASPSLGYSLSLQSLPFHGSGAVEEVVVFSPGQGFSAFREGRLGEDGQLLPFWEQISFASRLYADSENGGWISGEVSLKEHHKGDSQGLVLPVALVVCVQGLIVAIASELSVYTHTGVSKLTGRCLVARVGDDYSALIQFQVGTSTVLEILLYLSDNPARESENSCPAAFEFRGRRYGLVN
jgi:hypothetical protein